MPMVVPESLFPGVCCDVRRQCWRSQIDFFGRTHLLGRYNDEEEAACAYCAFVSELLGLESVAGPATEGSNGSGSHFCGLKEPAEFSALSSEALLAMSKAMSSQLRNRNVSQEVLRRADNLLRQRQKLEEQSPRLPPPPPPPPLQQQQPQPPPPPPRQPLLQQVQQIQQQLQELRQPTRQQQPQQLQKLRQLRQHLQQLRQRTPPPASPPAGPELVMPDLKSSPQQAQDPHDVVERGAAPPGLKGGSSHGPSEFSAPRQKAAAAPAPRGGLQCPASPGRQGKDTAKACWRGIRTWSGGYAVVSLARLA